MTALPGWLSLAQDWLTWALPPVEIIGAALIARRLTWRHSPVYLAFLIAECYIGVATSIQWITRDYSILARVILYPALFQETLRLSRCDFRAQIKGAILGASVALPALLAAIQPWTLDRKLSLFRGHFRASMALLFIGVVVYRALYPALEREAESRLHRIYRLGVTAWMTVVAVQSSFVQGGVGTWLVNYTPYRWAVIGASTYTALIVTILATAVSMTCVPGRKRSAVWAQRGKAVTGRIEQVAA